MIGQKRLDMEKANEEMECIICLETPTIPIFMCDHNHILCKNCRPKVEKCVVCNQELDLEDYQFLLEFQQDQMKKIDEKNKQEKKDAELAKAIDVVMNKQ